MLEDNESSIDSHLEDRDAMSSCTSLGSPDQEHQRQQSSASHDTSLEYICDGTNTSTQGTPGPTSRQSLQHQGSDDEPMGEGEDEDNGTMSTPGCHQGQENIYQAKIEAGNLIGTDERGHPHQMRLSSDGGHLNGMPSNLRSLTLR